jgi:glycosyltransferase involved in cell wall biosynthesis
MIPKHPLRRLARLAAAVRYERLALRDRPIAGVETDNPSPAAAVRWLGPIAVDGDVRFALFAHPVSRITYRFDAQPGDEVTAAAALLPDVWEKNVGGVEFLVGVRGRQSDRPSVSRVVVNPLNAADRRWHVVRTPIQVSTAGEVTITFDTRVPDGANGEHAWAAWGDLAVLRARPSAERLDLLRNAIRTGLRDGLRAAIRQLETSTLGDERKSAYRRWAAAHRPSPAELELMAAQAARFAYAPLVSVITPVFNTDPAVLEACIASVRAQAYPNWELCLADDGSTNEATRRMLARQTDPRIRLTRLDKNAGISAASNAALAIARGEFIALLDHDDEITPDALFHVVRELNDHSDADVLYSDEDKLDEDGGASEPFFKPCWSPDHLLSAMYTCHFAVARASLVRQAGGFRVGYEGAQDHDLMLRLSDLTGRIRHVPRILYHWRRTPQSTASAGSAKPWADDAGRRALADYLTRHEIAGDVVSGGVPGLYRVKFAIRGEPLVSIVSDGDSAWQRRLREATSHRTIELVRHVAAARGEHVLFLDGGLEPVDRDWLTALLEYSQQDAIGAVGARLEYADGRLRHVGVVTCLDGGPAAAFDGYPGDGYGYFSSAIGVRNYAAVSSECLITRRDVLERVGGWNARASRFGADVEYCARVRGAGLRVVFTPYARLRYAAQAPERRWSGPEDDPYYNPNLSRRTAYALGDTGR